MSANPDQFLAIVLVTSTLSYVFSLALVFWFKNFGGKDHSLLKIQSSHSQATPRLGGVAIISAIILVELIFGGIFRIWFLWAVLPIFIVGLLEDFHVETNPKIRLIVGAISSLLAIHFSNYWIFNVDLFLIEQILAISWVGIAFTVFASIGMINAINLIDGVNGLAAATTVITSLAIYLIAVQVGESGIASMAALVASASLGLFFFSYPNGRIFMGDSGAYTLGFLIAWEIIILLGRNPDLSAWSLLAITFWPVMDTLFSIYRRIRKGKDTKRADLLHFHQLTMRTWEVISNKRIPRRISNPLATATILPMALIPVIFGIKFSHDVFAGQIIIILSAVSYILIYKINFIVIRKRRLRNMATRLSKPIWSRFDTPKGPL